MRAQALRAFWKDAQTNAWLRRSLQRLCVTRVLAGWLKASAATGTVHSGAQSIRIEHAAD